MRAWIFAAVACLPLVGLADEVLPGGAAVDLTAFEQAEQASRFVEPAGLTRGDDGTVRRFYVAPIVGASWGQLLVDGDVALEPNLLTGGGAAGMAFTRPLGQLRVETEVRYRDGFGRSAASGPAAATISGTENWSFLINAWRDVSLTDRLGVYGGAGLGWGGYRFGLSLTDGVGSVSATSQNVTFAWQAGAGVLYAVSDRITLDLGYRFYAVEAGAAPVLLTDGVVPPVQLGNLANQFVANELLLTLRIYEPFRGWW